MKVEQFFQYAVGGLISLGALAIVARNGQGLGQFMTATSQAFSGFASGLSTLAGSGTG